VTTGYCEASISGGARPVHAAVAGVMMATETTIVLAPGVTHQAPTGRRGRGEERGMGEWG